MFKILLNQLSVSCVLQTLYIGGIIISGLKTTNEGENGDLWIIYNLTHSNFIDIAQE